MSMNAAIDEMGSNELDLPFKSATAVMKESDLSDTSRSIHIVTTASLPWMTGTAVNPLLRALYFQRTRSSCDARVTLVIPWVEKKLERNDVYQGKVKFSDGKVGRKEQEMFVRDWAANKAGMAEESKLIRIQFYPAKYRKKLGSILPMVDICSLIPANQADIAILEEPGK
jgi:digalactosyldiacylglycerol synthase